MPEDTDKPPLLRSWSDWYLLVLGFLLLQVVLYTLLTQTYA